MAGNKFIDQVESAKNQPVDFSACAHEAFRCSHERLTNQQTAANIAAMANINEGRQPSI